MYTLVQYLELSFPRFTRGGRGKRHIRSEFRPTTARHLIRIGRCQHLDVPSMHLCCNGHSE